MERDSYASLTDRDLVSAFQRGDHGAYEEMYRRYIERVRRSCARVLADPGEVEEAAQETFLKAYQALGRFNGSYKLGAWLSRIAVNLCIDHLRSRHQHLVPLPSDTHPALAAEGPEEVVAGGSPRLTETLNDMQPLHAAALKLRAVDGLSHREMAGQLAMTPSQVKALLHRARRSFKRAWERAEGWVLAPVFALRSTFADRSHTVPGAGVAGAPNLVGMMQSLTAMEKAVTSAVIAAVALSGMPSEPSGPTASSPMRRAAVAGPEVSGDRDEFPAPGAGESSAPSAGGRTGVLDDVLALAEKARDGAEPQDDGGGPPPGGGDDGGEDDGPLGGPASQRTKKALETGKKVAERTGETLTDL
ncbi:MAG: RNA polymerase sigma factor [Actinomycetota bacterium]